MDTVAPSDLVLAPSVRLLWREAGRVQLEMGSNAVQVDGLDESVIRSLTRPSPGPTRRRPAQVHTALDTLHHMGFLWTRAEVAQARAPELPSQLHGELAALSTVHGDRARALIDRRQEASVVIEGTGRLGPHIGALLAAAGVGTVYVQGAGDVSVAQAAPGGLLPEDEGQRYAAAAATAIRAAAPHVISGPPPFGTYADLVVLTADVAADPDPGRSPGQPHLRVRVGGNHGVVGPLVLPGRTTCLRCMDRHRSDRDQAWAALAIQLSGPGRRPVTSDVGLAAVIAGVAALQALTFLDGDLPATVAGTLELTLPDWRLRRRSWPAHPRCGCGAHRSDSL